jgi:hypothetical protein
VQRQAMLLFRDGWTVIPLYVAVGRRVVVLCREKLDLLADSYLCPRSHAHPRVRVGAFSPPCSLLVRAQLTYGTNDRFTATNCTVVSHELLTCLTAPGLGYRLPWAVTIAGQRSVDPLLVSYARPTVDAVFTAAANTRQGTGAAEGANWLTQGMYQASLGLLPGLLPGSLVAVGFLIVVVVVVV